MSACIKCQMTLKHCVCGCLWCGQLGMFCKCEGVTGMKRTPLKKGDRVMVTDAYWAKQWYASRSKTGRRGGVLVSIHKPYAWTGDAGAEPSDQSPFTSVRWDGLKTLDTWKQLNELCHDDPSKHVTPEQIRAERKTTPRSTKMGLVAALKALADDLDAGRRVHRFGAAKTLRRCAHQIRMAPPLTRERRV